MDIVVSGIRSTGNLHLGNYFGALRNFFGCRTKTSVFLYRGYSFAHNIDEIVAC